MRREWKWTEHQLDKLNKVQIILEELKDYKPLTLRQVYYQLVGKGYIENNKSQYGMLSGLLKWARLEGRISWDDIEDRVRAFHNLTGYDRAETFVEYSMNSFLYGYKRDLLQTQGKYLEIWIEKDALSSIFTKVAEDYTVPVVVCKGFSSISFLREFKERISGQDREPVMLYFGDFDPSGVAMLDSMELTLRTEFNIEGIRFKRVALMREDVFEYSLPHNPDAIKKSDTRAKKHVEEYGELAVELDALRPDILEDKIREAIHSEIDLIRLNSEIAKHNEEFERLQGLKAKTKKLLAKELRAWQ